jgi:predicted  nucleic acid-binding Zn-ribbon protein
MASRTPEQIKAHLAEAADELQRITRSIKNLEDAGVMGSATYRSLREELPIAQRRHDEFETELARLDAPPAAKDAE